MSTNRTIIIVPALISKKEVYAYYKGPIDEEIFLNRELVVLSCYASNCLIHDYLCKNALSRTYIYIVGEEKKSCTLVNKLEKSHVIYFKTTDERDKMVNETCDKKIRWVRMMEEKQS